MNLKQLNALSVQQAFDAFETCCVSTRWIEAMIESRPFASVDIMLEVSSQIWQQSSREDILQAFEGHPRIGDVESLQKKYANTSALAGHEQAGMTDADKETMQRMASLNTEYFDKFGFIFIVCASGKTAQQMLALLEARLPNDPVTELSIAAQEQGKITLLRLQKLVSEL